MRAMLLLLIGLFMGAMCGMIATRQIATAHAYPRGVMAVLQRHLGAAKAQVNGAGQCDAIATRQHLETIRRFLPELLPSLTPLNAKPERRIAELHVKLGEAVDRSLATPIPADCAALTQPIRDVEQACTDCHSEFR
jgi:cytochrome c556